MKARFSEYVVGHPHAVTLLVVQNADQFLYILQYHELNPVAFESVNDTV